MFDRRINCEYNKYKTFILVVELGSLTRAAEATGITQSAVSHIINSMEREFGFSLLRRGKSGAALTADEIAGEAEFFSFGTNDLTQMTFGFSRDDAGKFLNAYYEKKIYESDPFARLDQVGVGKLVEMAARLGRAARPDLHLGICGEHGGDPSSIEFCHRTGLDYVSCSPYRVPIARLAAAQAKLKNN